MPSKPKILFVAEELAINGAMRSLIALLNSLPKEEYDLSLFLFKHSDNIQNLIPNYVRVLPEVYSYVAHRMPLGSSIIKSLLKFRLDLVLYRILVAIQRLFGIKYNLWPFLPTIQGSYDVVCCYTDGFAAPLIEHKVQAEKRVCWIHCGYSHWPQERFVYEALIKADACVPVSCDVGFELDHILGVHTRQYIVHNITDSCLCIKKASEPCAFPRKNGVYRIVSVGRITASKGFDLIPDIAKELLDRRVRFEWIIVGEGEDRDLVYNRLLKEQLCPYVFMIGSRSNPMPIINSADVFVNPSRFESWGMTVSEALCLGKAVVVSDLPVFREQIKDGYNGLMRPREPKLMAEAIQEVLTDTGLKRLLENNAVNYPFSRQRVVEEFGKMIHELLGPASYEQ